MRKLIHTALAPAADAILEIVYNAMPQLEEGFKRIEENAGIWAVTFAGILKSVAGLAVTFFRSFREASSKQLGLSGQEAGEQQKRPPLKKDKRGARRQLGRGTAGRAPLGAGDEHAVD